MKKVGLILLLLLTLVTMALPSFADEINGSVGAAVADMGGPKSIMHWGAGLAMDLIFLACGSAVVIFLCL